MFNPLGFVRHLGPWAIWGLVVIFYTIFRWPGDWVVLVLMGWFSVLVYLSVMKAWRRWKGVTETGERVWGWGEQLVNAASERIRGQQQQPPAMPPTSPWGQQLPPQYPPPQVPQQGVYGWPYPPQCPQAGYGPQPPMGGFPAFGSGGFGGGAALGPPCDVAALVNMISHLLDAEGIQPHPGCDQMALAQAGAALVTAFRLSPTLGVVPQGVAAVSQQLTGVEVASVRLRICPPAVIANVVHAVLAADGTAQGVTTDDMELAMRAAAELLKAMQITPIDDGKGLSNWPVMEQLVKKLPQAPTPLQW